MEPFLIQMAIWAIKLTTHTIVIAIPIRYWARKNHQYSLLRALPEKVEYFLRQVFVASVIEGIGRSL